MKKNIFLLIAILNLAEVFAQKEKFDIASFTPPSGWQRIDTNGTLAYFQSITKDGLTSFSQIVLFPSRISTGNVTNDFKLAWNNMIAIPAKTTVKPKTEKLKAKEGWNIIRGTANINQPGLSYTGMVVTVSGFGKTMSFLVNMAGKDFVGATERFFAELDLDKNAQASNNSNTASSNIQNNTTATTTLKDYEFATPEGWQVQNKPDHILIQNLQSGCSIRIIPSQASSGDLDQDAKAVFDLMYSGWNYSLSGERKYLLSKGTTMQGLPYSMIEASMSATGTDGRYNLEEGAARVIKTGNGISIISIRHNSGLMAHDACRNNYNTIGRFLNNFMVKNAPSSKNNEDVASKIIGVWTYSGGGVATDFTFAANGKYQSLNGVGTTTVTSDYYYKYIETKSSAFEGDGSYSVTGNQLTMTNRGNNKPEQMRVRFEKINKGGMGWTDRLCLLKRDATIGKEYEACYERRKL